jgi:hypothetical protein
MNVIFRRYTLCGDYIRNIPLEVEDIRSNSFKKPTAELSNSQKIAFLEETNFQRDEFEDLPSI